MSRGEHREAAAVAFETTSPPLQGETLDIDTALADKPEETEAMDPSDTRGNGGATAEKRAPASPHAPMGPTADGASKARTRVGESGAPVAAAPPALYGAVGVRYAVDLPTSFTRGFPQAASADPLWSTTPFGPAGVADLVVILDDTGHIANRSIGGTPSTALRRGIERTLALLGTRPFTARGAVTHLRIAAHVTRNDVHDGLHGDVFALSSGNFVGDTGAAFFALPPTAGPGRRVDVELRLLP